MLKIVEYVGPDNNNQHIQYGTPFLVIGYCGDVWELSKTSWYDLKENQDAVRYRYNNLMVDLSVSDEHYQKYFRFSQEISK